MRIGFTPEFKRNLKYLARRYRNIRSDLDSLIQELEAGVLPGDQISGAGFTVFKVRIRNSDVGKGKSGGYRVIYYLQTDEDIILVTIYSKSNQSDISAATIRKILNELQSD